MGSSWRVVLSFVVLLVPATLLGATLPLVASSSAVRGAGVGSRIGVLYATNTLGAVAGTLLAGFWMIGSLGISTSFRIAAATNGLVGLSAIVVSRRTEARHAGATAALSPDDATAADRPPRHVDPLTERGRRAVLAVFAASGFVTIAIEVVWFRVLVLYVESNTYAYTIMLAAVLVGIALGGYVASAVMHRWGSRVLHLAIAELAVSITAVTSFFVLARSFTVNGRYGGLLDVFGADVRFAVVAGVMTVLPTALLFGVAFPIGLRLWLGDAEGEADTSGRVGTFYAVNVCAGILGSVVAGFVLVPYVGTRGALILLSAVLLLSGVALAAMVAPRPRRVGPALAAGGAVAFVVAASLAAPDPYDAALTYRYPGERVLWRDEGPQTSVSIHEQADGTRVMYLDGLHQANSSPGMVAYHRLIGTLPLAVHADPRTALVVGLGGGVTAGALSDDPNLDVEVVELSPEVVEGAEWLAPVNGDVVNRANVDVHVDDGRNFLLTTEQHFDVITADLILPQHAGAGKLWSEEYWELARDALAPGGVMVQWVPTDRARDYALIVRSFLSVFPHVSAWAGGSMLVGSSEPLVIDPIRYEARLIEGGVGDALAVAGMGSVEALRAMYTAGRDELEAHVGPGPLLTDDRPRLEFWKSSGRDRERPVDLSGLRGDPTEVIRPS